MKVLAERLLHGLHFLGLAKHGVEGEHNLGATANGALGTVGNGSLTRLKLPRLVRRFYCVRKRLFHATQ